MVIVAHLARAPVCEAGETGSKPVSHPMNEELKKLREELRYLDSEIDYLENEILDLEDKRSEYEDRAYALEDEIAHIEREQRIAPDSKDPHQLSVL